MKKKLVIISDESIISGNARTGVADVTDGLANALSNLYSVTVVCPDGKGSVPEKMHAIKEGDLRKFNIFGTSYVLVDISMWEKKRASIVDSLTPDIVHNLSDPIILAQMKATPGKTVYTIDNVAYVLDKIEELDKYDCITTVSRGYAEELLAGDDALAKFLHRKQLAGITNGITTAFCNPETGIMIPNKFNRLDMRGKIVCKEALLKRHSIVGNPPIFTVICRLVKEKGIDAIIEVIPRIAEAGGVLLVYGRGDTAFEEALRAATDNVIWVQNNPRLHKVLPILAGADFYLSPSVDEPCGLMPMVACMYGAIPIVTHVGGLRDNFDHNNALIVKESLKDSIDEAVALYKNPIKLTKKRLATMSVQFDWRHRIKEYIDIYEKI